MIHWHIYTQLDMEQVQQQLNTYNITRACEMPKMFDGPGLTRENKNKEQHSCIIN